MSKSVLVMETPERCMDCEIGRNMSNCMEVFIHCPVTGKVVLDEEAETIPDECPLKPLPEHMLPVLGGDDWMNGYIKGYNACIDEIAGGD